jgi:AcrR family transcriptional regulator
MKDSMTPSAASAPANTEASPETPAEPNQRSWRGVAPDDRRAERRSILLATAFELLGTDGWRGTTVRRVCEASRLNPRYFYESFDGLESLLLAVFDELMGEVNALTTAALAEADGTPIAQAKAIVGSLMRFVTDDPRRARILFVEALGEERMGRHRLDTLHATAQVIDGYVRRQWGGPTHPDPTTMVAAHLFMGGLSELVIAWLDNKLDGSRDELIDDTAALMVSLMGSAADRASAGSPSTTR